MEVERIINNVFNSNTFILHHKREAIIVDIGDITPLLNLIQEKELNVKALFITHTHYDHIYGIREFMKHFPGVQIYTSSFGKEAFNKSNWNFSRYHDNPIEIESDSIKALSQSDSIKVFQDKEVLVLETPGHDKSSLTFMIEDYLFTGDSFIPGVKVIASFPNSNRKDAQYWYARIKEMSENYIVCPGHGEILSR